MKQKPGVMIYFDMLPVLDLLSNQDKGTLFHAILSYAQTGELMPMNEHLSLLWPLIRQRLDFDSARYEQTVMKRKYAAYTRWERQNDRIPIPYSQWVEDRGYETDREADIHALA